MDAEPPEFTPDVSPSIVLKRWIVPTVEPLTIADITRGKGSIVNDGITTTGKS